MAFKRIIYQEAEPGIIKIMMNRPEKRNAMDPLMLDELEEAWTQAAYDEDVRVIIYGGTGKDFCSGHDLSDQREEARKGTRVRKINDTRLTGVEGRLKKEDYVYLNQAYTVRNIGKPTIAMVQGNCVGAGWMAAAVCDLIVASDDAQFINPMLRMATGATEILFEAYDLGFRKAKEILWTGEPVSAQEGKELGFISRVATRENLEEETLNLARRISMNMPIAVSLIKKSINQAWDLMGQRSAWEYQLLIHQLTHASDENKTWRDGRRATAMKEGGVKEMLRARDSKFKEAGGKY
ncbi:MAG: enoyl-CoA hydratase [Dehalococcoidales bacterium]|nr:enoyl-CoA hydratase [Dehalococcoidales bacterium]